MRLQPQAAGDDRRIYAEVLPPSGFIATAVDLAMMSPAQRDRELIAHLAPERWVLCEAKVVSIRGLPAAKQAG
jgi:hypothetical protein